MKILIVFCRITTVFELNILKYRRILQNLNVTHTNQFMSENSMQHGVGKQDFSVVYIYIRVVLGQIGEGGQRFEKVKSREMSSPDYIFVF